MITALERQPYLMKREQKKAMEVFTESVISFDKKDLALSCWVVDYHY